MPWNPPKPKPKAATPVAPPTAVSAAPVAEKREAAGAIDKSLSLGISEEVLARRAAKWGPMPDKKAAASPITPTAAVAEPAPAKTQEITP
jgi:Zn-dependent peptidase ImmA (M78 family)